MTTHLDSSPANDPIIVISRVFNAPRPLVFQAITNGEYLAQWFGPEGFTVPSASMDARVGGKWHIDMQAADGTIYPNKGVVLEVIENEKLVASDDVDEDETAWGGTPPPSVVNTYVLEDAENGQTRLTLTSRMSSIEKRDQLLAMGAVEGFGSSLNKMDALLAKLQAA
jgi:uncharacterized protein YndB with AHSA1/START domain